MLIKFGTFVSWTMIVFGVMRTALGLVVAFTFPTATAMEAAATRYLGSAKSGEAIDQGLMLMVGGIFLGLVAKIAKNGSQRRD